jgi:hypothetical protein
MPTDYLERGFPYSTIDGEQYQQCLVLDLLQNIGKW